MRTVQVALQHLSVRVVLILAALLLFAGRVDAERYFSLPPVEIIPPETPLTLKALRVCSDPNNLPFSNASGEGFENRIAELLSEAMGVPLSYTWRAQRRGFIRNTLRVGECDVVMGMPTGYELVSSTRPYYRSTYVFVTRAGDPAIKSLDDPLLREVRVGVHLIGDDGANTPGAHSLGKRGIVDNVVGYTIYGNYAKPNPPARLVEAVAEGEIDVAIVWGPFAGYFGDRLLVPLHLEPVSPSFDPPSQAFVFSISMGVRRGNYPLRRRLNQLIQAHREEINAIIDAYGVPRIGREKGD